MTASNTLVRSDETEVFLKATWGDNVVICRFDQEEDAWEITETVRLTPNGSLTTNVYWTLAPELDIDYTVYYRFYDYTYCICQIEYSTSPDTAGLDLATYNPYQGNLIKQYANSHWGSGGGAGTTKVESTGKVQATILANIKNDI